MNINVISDLNRLLDKYDKLVFFTPDFCRTYDSLVEELYIKCFNEAESESKRYLFIFEEVNGTKDKSTGTYVLDPIQSYEIKTLYRTYEFSDKFILIDVHDEVGTMINYYTTGVLSKDEVILALFELVKK